MGALSPIHWLIIIGVVVVLFGAKKLPEAARGLGRSSRILKAELHGLHEDPAPASSTPHAEATPATAAANPARHEPTAIGAAHNAAQTAAANSTADQPAALARNS